MPPAGSEDLRAFFRDELARIKKNHSWSQKRLLEEKLIDEKEREIYYSAWYYPVIHVMVSIPKFQQMENIIRYLTLEERVVHDAVNFLLKCGLVRKSGDRIVLGNKSIQFERGSREYKNFLKNLKNRAIFSIDRDIKDDLHSAFVLSLSQEDPFILSMDLFLV